MWSPTYSSDELYHHGILGMKWGVRRYQNEDGTLTPAGEKRYLDSNGKLNKAGKKAYVKAMKKDLQSHYEKQVGKKIAKGIRINDNFTESSSGTSKDYKALQKEGSAQFHKSLKAASAARTETKNYMYEKYGESAVKAMIKSGVLGRKIDDFTPKTLSSGKAIVERKAKKIKTSSLSSYLNTKSEKEMKYNPKTGKMERHSRVSALSGANKAKADLIYMQSKANADRIASQKSKKSSENSSSLTGRFNTAKKDIPNLSYDKIYKEMKVNMNSEDPSVYKKAEDKWLKKHGY